jgi:hypothetical protein
MLKGTNWLLIHEIFVFFSLHMKRRKCKKGWCYLAWFYVLYSCFRVFSGMTIMMIWVVMMF